MWGDTVNRRQVCRRRVGMHDQSRVTSHDSAIRSPTLETRSKFMILADIILTIDLVALATAQKIT